MASSSNRHWPSMYRSSLACNNQQQPQPDMNNGVGGAGGKSSLMASRCDEGRNPEPRPRWNPRPEQIRILEGIFNSGMVNPPRDEIRRIRIQLSEYGPVGDANVFYWFQNRKSRTKHKMRAAGGQLQPSGRAALQVRACATSPQAPAPATPPRHLLPAPVVAAPTSSSSSSSDRSSGSSKSVKPAAVALASSTGAAAIQAGYLPATAMDFLTPAPARQQPYYRSQIVAPPTTTVLPTPESMITSPDPFLQWQQSQYLPATELGGLLGAQYAHMPAAMHSPVVVSPNVVLGLCNEALGQDCFNLTSSDKRLGYGPYWDNGTEELMSTKTDAVSAVIRDDEKARLGSLHYDFGLTTTAAAAATSAPLAAPVHGTDVASMFPSAAAAPINDVAATTSAVLTDQLQGLLEFGLIGRTAAPPTATVVAVARDAVTTCTSSVQFSVPAIRLDVKQFGEAAVLLRHPGEPVLVDEAGVTVEPLQQDALYYVLVTGDLLNTLYTE